MPGYSRVPKLVNAITKTVVKATMGSGAKPAVKKPFPKPVKPTLKKSSPATRAKTDVIQKSSVKVKPAAKQKPNPPSKTKMREYEISSVSRSFNPMTGEMAEGSVGKLRDMRIAKSKIFKSQNPIGTKKDIKVMENRNSKRPVVKVNSANLKPNKIIKKRGK